jgi:hypothetical protein
VRHGQLAEPSIEHSCVSAVFISRNPDKLVGVSRVLETESGAARAN